MLALHFVILYVVSCNFFNYLIIKKLIFYENNNNIYIYILFNEYQSFG